MHLVLVDSIPLQLDYIHCCGWRKGRRIVVVEEGRPRRGRGGDGELFYLVHSRFCII